MSIALGDYYKITTRITRATARVARTILHYLFYTINVYCMGDPRGQCHVNKERVRFMTY